MKSIVSPKKKIQIVLFAAVFFLTFCLFKSIISAYLIDTDVIARTFVIGELVENKENDFVLKEHEIIDINGDGVYELGSNEVVWNTYNVYPAVDIPKDPFIRLNNLKNEAYLYVEVVGYLSENFQWSINDNWLKTTLTGKNGGMVYVYKGTSSDAVILNKVSGNDLTVYILSGIDGSVHGGITIGNDFATDNVLNLNFYGYLIQSKGFESHVDAFENCFGD